MLSAISLSKWRFAYSKYQENMKSVFLKNVTFWVVFLNNMLAENTLHFQIACQLQRKQTIMTVCNQYHIIWWIQWAMKNKSQQKFFAITRQKLLAYDKEYATNWLSQCCG